MHGNMRRNRRPYPPRRVLQPLLLLGAACVAGVVAIAVWKPQTRVLPPLPRESVPVAILPTPARLRRRSERFA